MRSCDSRDHCGHHDKWSDSGAGSGAWKPAEDCESRCRRSADRAVLPEPNDRRKRNDHEQWKQLGVCDQQPPELERVECSWRLRRDQVEPGYRALDARLLDQPGTEQWRILLGGIQLSDRAVELEPAFEERDGEAELHDLEQHG